MATSRPDRTSKSGPKPRKKKPSTNRGTNGDWMRLIFDHALDGVALADINDKHLVMANPAFCRMLGYTPDEIPRLPINDLHPVDQLATVVRNFERQSAGAINIAKDTPMLRKDGSVFYADINSSVVTVEGRPHLLGIFRDVTDRKCAEQKPQNSEDRLQALFDNMIEGVALHELLLDADGQPVNYRIVVVNPQYERIVGLRREDVVGKLATEVYGPSALANLGVYGQVVLTGRSCRIEAPFAPTDKHLDISVTPWGLNGFATIFEDITARNRAAEALKSSEDRYRSATELLSDYIFRVRIQPDGTAAIESVSANYERITGRRVIDVVQSHDWLKTIHPEDRPRMGQLLQRLIREGGEDHSEFRTFILRNGKEFPRWVEVSSKAERDHKTGRVFAITGAVRDITDRKTAELQQRQAADALRASEARFRKIIEQSPLSMAIVGMDGTIEFINQKAIDTFGYQPGDIPDMDHWWVQAYPDQVYRSEVIATWSAYVDRAIAQNREIEGHEYRVTCRDRTIKTVFIFGVPVANKVFVMFDDITERKRAEEDLRRRTEELMALNTLSREVGASLSLNQVTAAALREMRKAVRTDLAFLFLREGERLVFQKVEPEETDRQMGQCPEHRVGACLCGLAVGMGRPVFSREIATDPRCTMDVCKKAGFHSFAALPLLSGSDVIGVIGLASLTERDFENQERFLETLAGSVSAGIQNANLFAATKRAAITIEDERQFSDSIIEGLPGVFYLFDDSGQFLRWNRNFEIISGYSAEEFTRLHPMDFFKGPDREHIAEQIQKVFAEGMAFAEASLVAKDGSSRPYYFTGIRIAFEDKPCLIGVGLDISERKRAEEAHRESEQRFRAIFDSTFQFTGLMTLDGILTEANRAALDFAGTRREDTVNRPFWETHWWRGNEARVRQLKEAIQRAVQGEFVRYEVELQGAGKHTAIIDFSIKPIFDAQGKVILLVPEGRDITERKRAEDAVRESEEHYRQIFEINPDAMFLIGEDGHFLDANQAAIERYGYTLDEFRRMGPPDLAADDLKEEAVKKVREGLTNPLRLEWRHRNKDGREIWVEVQTQPTELRGQRCQFSNVRDITERKRVEEALRHRVELQDQIARIAASVPGVICSFKLRPDGTACMPFASSALRDLYGLDPAAVQEDFSPILRLVHPDDAPKVWDAIQESARTLEPWHAQFRVDSPTKGEIWVEGRSVPRREPDGATLWHGFIFDITDRKRAEEALEHNEKFLRALSENLADGMVYQVNSGTHGELRVFTYLSPVVETLHGLKAEEVKRDPTLLYNQFVDEDRERLAKLEEHCSATRTPLDIDARVRLPSGEVRWRHFRSTPRMEPDGSVIWDGIEFDITERRQLEERLRQSEKLTAIGQLAGGVAHDFNNQLAGVMGYASLLENRLQEEQLRRFAQGISVSARRAADLTQKLLAFSRKGKYLSVPVDIHHLLDEVVAILERSIDKRIRISQVLRARHPIVLGDPTQIQNALLNLSLNARDAMDQGGELTFQTDLVDFTAQDCRLSTFNIVPGPYLRVSIADTGCGMNDEVKRHLFEPFFTTKKVGEGTGMGLASVYGTVQNHRGTVSVASEPGHGTTFQVCLPLAPEATQTDSTDSAATPTRGSAKILLVDDERIVREMGADLLRDLGYHVATCADGQEAVDYYREHWQKVDLVILDMVMPRMGGRDTFVAMREINPEIRALLSSGYSLDGEAQSILKEGVLAFVGKPYQQSDLARKIEEALAQSPPTQ